MTASEATLWRLLRRNQLGVRFRRQEPIGPYIVDFVALTARLVVEADGDPYHSWSDDEQRDGYLRSLGYRVLRFENNDIMFDPQLVVEEIRSHLCPRRRGPGEPS